MQFLLKTSNLFLHFAWLEMQPQRQQPGDAREEVAAIAEEQEERQRREQARAQASICQASAEVLTASAGASYGAAGLQAHARATLARAEASAGPVQVGVGLNLDCGASVGPDGLQITLFGFGFSLGPRAGVRTPVLDAQCSVM
eukprot:Skav214405  [mRNA]  locus=scaffold3796:4211:5163:- [translate_table: standard]